MPWLDRVREHEARSLPPRLRVSVRETRERAQQDLRQLVHETGNMAGLAAHRVAGIARSQGAVLADAAARRTLGAARAVRNDPLPVVMGMIGAICLARLLLGGRRRHRQG